jgi:hypothetical protein
MAGEEVKEFVLVGGRRGIAPGEARLSDALVLLARGGKVSLQLADLGEEGVAEFLFFCVGIHGLQAT